MSDLNMSTTITPDEAIKLLGLAIKPRVIKEIELSVAPDVTDKFLEAINMAIEALGKPEPDWIPVTKKLPKVKQRVIVQYEDGSMEIRRCIDAGHLQWFYARAVAWMPAPERYEGVTEW